MNTNQKGDLAELKVAARLAEQGFTVLRPWGDARYDLVAETPRGFVRVQVKFCSAKNGKIVLRRESVVRDGRKLPYTPSEADAIAVYCPETEGVYFFPVEGPTQQVVRIERPAIVYKNMLHASDYAELI